MTVSATKADHPKQNNSGGRGSAAAGDVTISFDKTKVATISKLKRVFEDALKVIASGTELTP